ncbi:MAG: phage tail sheath subtilisin-like domain-containing protein [Alphaproteobacteria bacterium]
MADTFLHGVEILELDSGSRPVSTVKSSVIGLVGTAPMGPVNTPTLILGSKTDAVSTFGEHTDGYTIPAALDAIFDQTGAIVVVVNVADPDVHLTDGVLDPTLVSMGDIIGGTTTDGQYTGVQCLLAAQTEVSAQPRILIAPGFTHEEPEDDDGEKLVNPVVSELLIVAERLRAVAIADCQNSTKEDAVSYQSQWGSSRLYTAYPWAKVYDSDTDTIREEPLSARIAGLIAQSDNDRGFWWSPSNLTISGIVGISKPIDFTLGDSSCVANYLNENNVATVIQQDGFRLWGNRTASADSKWAFLSVRRTADMINDSLLNAHLWAVDRNITVTYVEDVCDSVNNYLRYLKNIGAVLGGSCWADSSINTSDQIQQGKITFDFDFTPPYPAEHIIFRSRMVDDYLTELFS